MKWFGRSLIALVLIVGVFLYINSQQKPVEPPAPVATPEASPSQSPEPSPTPSPSETHYLVPVESDQTGASPLPSVNESDPSIEAELQKLIGKEKAEAIFNLNHIVRRVVVSIDNATKHIQISQEFSPFKPLATPFRVTGKNEELALSPANFDRYSPYVGLARSINTQKIANLYIHFYPLFQSAFQDLGVKGYFNDRVIAAMDTVLDTPEVTDPIKLIRAPIHPVYKFADEKLESLPAVQKIMIRMGSQNSLIIKTKLRELREIFAHLDQLKK
jgi:hypothetical protein